MKRALSPETSEGPLGKKARLSKSEELQEEHTDLPYSNPGHTAEHVPFQQPQQLLTFSYTPAHELEFTDSALRYYVGPPPGADLRYGYERWIKRPEEKGRVDNLLRAVSRICEKMDTAGTNGADWLKSIGVVSWRGVMTKYVHL